MKRSNAFTLVELLTAISVHLIFILMLGVSFYGLVAFGGESQQILTAREHGRRVIDYVDEKIKKVGLGMWDLDSCSDFNDALKPLTGSSAPLYKLKMPLSVVWDNSDEINTDYVNQKNADVSGNVQRGNVLTMLYADRDYDVNLTVTHVNETTTQTTSEKWIDDVSKMTEQEVQTRFNEIDALLHTIINGDSKKSLSTKIEDMDEKVKNFWYFFVMYIHGVLGVKGERRAGKTIDIVNNYYENEKFRDSSQTLQKMLEILYNNGRYYELGSNIEKNYWGTLNKDYLRMALQDIWDVVNDKYMYYKYLENGRIRREDEWIKLYQWYQEDKNPKQKISDSTLEYFIDEVNKLFHHSIETSTTTTTLKTEFLVSSMTYDSANFKDEDSNLQGWSTMLGIGKPFMVSAASSGSGSDLELKFANNTNLPTIEIDELLRLKCERIFAEDDTSDNARNFKVQKLSDGTLTDWGEKNSFETGILEIYAELDTDTSVLDFYVLSTGGRDRMTHSRPDEWPSTARWKDDYKNQVLYVSRASWKLNNLKENFDWE